MRWLVTAQEMKQYDQNTMERTGIPGMVLMERAALESLKVLKEEQVLRPGGCVFVLAGTGNNGGDGLALARLLTEAGMQVEIQVAGSQEKASQQWTQQRKILEAYPVTFCNSPARKEYTVIVDALFGVGLSRNLEGEYRQAVENLNALSGFKIALDMPSGVNSDKGSIMGVAFRADVTVTFGFEKRGLYFYPGCEMAGKTVLADVGINSWSFYGSEPSMFYREEEMKCLFPERNAAGNKGTFGKALLVAGNEKMAGAAVLSSRSCYRTGAGMVKVITEPENRRILMESIPEVLYGTGEDLTKETFAWCDGICAGPGLGTDEKAAAKLDNILKLTDKPLVLDADGIILLTMKEERMELLRRQTARGRQVIFTPHMGELKKLVTFLSETGKLNGMPSGMQELKEHMAEVGLTLSEYFSAVFVIKDARTCVCLKNSPVFLNHAGNSGMATAGSGDVLAGIITGLLVQGLDAFEAACRGVRMHALAGDAAAEKMGEHGLMAGDICEAVRP